jgi:hypothetical protein
MRRSQRIRLANRLGFVSGRELYWGWSRRWMRRSAEEHCSKVARMHMLANEVD